MAPGPALPGADFASATRLWCVPCPFRPVTARHGHPRHRIACPPAVTRSASPAIIPELQSKMVHPRALMTARYCGRVRADDPVSGVRLRLGGNAASPGPYHLFPRLYRVAVKSSGTGASSVKTPACAYGQLKLSWIASPDEMHQTGRGAPDPWPAGIRHKYARSQRQQ